MILLNVMLSFLLSSLGPAPWAYAGPLNLPAPGTMVNLSPAYDPVLIKGLTVHKDNPFLFDFIVDVGQDRMAGEPLKKEGLRLIKYFLASLAIPGRDLWVNLSPYEKTRIIPEALGQTDMGRDLLEEDYLLKQITASLIDPEKRLGQKFWQEVYTQAQMAYGTTDIPMDAFNKVWITADRAEVFERGQTAFVVDSHLKVVLEEDYLALQKHSGQPGGMPPQGACPQAGCQADKPLNTKATQGKHGLDTPSHSMASKIIRQIILPQLEHEVNTGRNFAHLRQIFNSIILASWYKKNLRQATLNQVYSDKSRVRGINLNDPAIKQKIYEQYLKAYKKGVFNYIKEDTANGVPIPRKYFSGGMDPGMAINPAVTADFAMLGKLRAAEWVSITTGFTNAAMQGQMPAHEQHMNDVKTPPDQYGRSMTGPRKILLVAPNNPEISGYYAEVLTKAGYTVERIDKIAEAEEILAAKGADILMATANVNISAGGLDLIRFVGRQKLDVPVALISDMTDVRNWSGRLGEAIPKNFGILKRREGGQRIIGFVLNSPLKDMAMSSLDPPLVDQVLDRLDVLIRNEPMPEYARYQSMNLIALLKKRYALEPDRKKVKDWAVLLKSYLYPVFRENSWKFAGKYSDRPLAALAVHELPALVETTDFLVREGVPLNPISAHDLLSKVDIYFGTMLYTHRYPKKRKTAIVQIGSLSEIGINPFFSRIQGPNRTLAQKLLAVADLHSAIFDMPDPRTIESMGFKKASHEKILELNYPLIWSLAKMYGLTPPDIEAGLPMDAPINHAMLSPSGQDKAMIKRQLAGNVVNKAQLANVPGGIDLNTFGIHWAISKDGRGVEMNVNPAMIERIKKDGIRGLSPVIFAITPVVNIWSLAGLPSRGQI